MTFNVGEKVVYPNHGVGTIENISTRTFGESQERFYLLRLTYNSMTVMVPFSHVTDVGLRKVTRTADVSRVLTYLASGPCRFSADWKVRFKVNSEKMRCGGLLDIAEVFKALAILHNEKPLSFREKKMLDCSRRMLIAEVSICRAIGEAEAIDLLSKALGKANLPMPPAL
ncbi:MAG TPA: CarD family transcriptional regulator [Bryobacteraceae bacterium]|nr:CarD family transcriptional regulator [Bryobacteraceae bacterium]